MSEIPFHPNYISADINWTAVILIVSALIIFPLQLWLCHKTKRIAVRLLPTILFAVMALILALVAYLVGSWEGLFILLLALYAAFVAIVCMLGVFFGIVINHFKNKQK